MHLRTQPAQDPGSDRTKGCRISRTATASGTRLRPAHRFDLAVTIAGGSFILGSAAIAAVVFDSRHITTHG
jgi:hypothetical protein